MERWSALGNIRAQARRNLAQARLEMKYWMLSSSISLKQENFRLGEIHSRPSDQILAQARLLVKKKLKFFIFSFESLVYYCILFFKWKF